MGTIVYELKDQLNHHKYEWPLSLVRYPLRLEVGQAHPDSFDLRDDAGRPIPVQVIGAELQDGFVISGEVVFLTDLPRGATRRYELHYRSGPVAAGPEDKREGRESACPGIALKEYGACLHFDNGLLDIGVPNAGLRLDASAERAVSTELFRLTLTDGGELAKARLSSDQRLSVIRSECVSSGPVMHEQRINCVWETGGHYTVLLRLIVGMPYVELEEEMEHCAAGARLEIAWEGLNAIRRYTRNRGVEEVDAYVGDQGELPFLMLPYDNVLSWHRVRAAAFFDEGKQLAAGLFHGDSMKWNDGEYALWRSSDTLAIRFYCGNGERNVAEESGLRWSYPLSDGVRATKIALYDTNRERAVAASAAFRKLEAGECEPLIDELALWHSFLPLDKVKDWVLDWEEPQEQYPLLFEPEALPETMHWWYFERHEPPQPDDMEEVVDKLSFSFNQVGSTGPVTSREFASWVPIFDLSANAMTPEQFKRFKAASAFMAYVREDEYVAPIHTMLAGHPNFLADFKAVPGYMSALFPHHPHAGRWMNHFEKAVALNLKYHTRPDVAAWNARGGRWTENLGGYVWAALVPVVRAAWCLRRTYGDNPLLYPNMAKLAGWLLNSLSAPLAGGRSYPPQGAHAGARQDPLYPSYALRVLGEMLLNYDPLLAEQLLAVCPVDAQAIGSTVKGDVWRYMLKGRAADNSGTPPRLESAKYTGYGYTLRSEAGKPGEMSVHLQQIDEGPNYRWGRSGDGGNGVIYYYADGKRYSYNRPEDVGDDNMGAGEGSSSFAVLSGHEYTSIGRNELTGQLHDFGFAQFASLEAGPTARPMYRSRSVIMSGNDYIAIYDEVADMRVRGRFSWFTHRDEEFPRIYQLKPGASASEVSLGGPVDAAPVPPGEYTSRNDKKGYPDGSKGRYYDGFGDFLTVVTHLGEWQPQLTGVQATSFGAVISLVGRTDYVFRSASRIRYASADISFDGYSGIVRHYGKGHAEAALFRGRSIAANGIVATVTTVATDSPAGAFAFTTKGGALSGRSSGEAPLVIMLELPSTYATPQHKLYVDGNECRTGYNRQPDRINLEFTLPQGRAEWQWTDGDAIPGKVAVAHVTIASPHEADVSWEAVAGADGYETAISEDGCRTWSTSTSDVCAESYRLAGLRAGTKLHVRVRARNGNAAGAWSEPYPINATERPPDAPEGLRLSRGDERIEAIWGMVPGAQLYRLYRRKSGEETSALLYEGPNRAFEDDVLPNGHAADYVYSVSAINGNGEGPHSRERDTASGGLIDWDPRPDEPFRRYVRSHEYGHNGFHYWDNERKGSWPPYPRS
jgi:hypothetical protein